MLMKRLFFLAAALMLLGGLLAGGAVLWVLFHRFPGESFDANGVPVHYTVEGEGEPVVLVHGFAIHADLNWRYTGVLPALCKEYQVITLDVRGHGLSGKPHDPAQYGEELALDVIRLLDHLGIEKAHVVGYSMGGFITVKLLADHPDRLLSAAPCASGWLQSSGDNLALHGKVERGIDGRASFLPLLHFLNPGGNRLTRWRMALVDRVMCFMNDEEALLAVWSSLPALEVTEAQLRSTNVPVLSVVGEKDSLKAAADAMVGVVPDHRLVVLDGADHMIDAAARPEFRRSLLDFLHEHRGGVVAASSGT